MVYNGCIRTVAGSILVVCLVSWSHGQVCNKTVTRTRMVNRPQTYTVMTRVGGPKVMTKLASQVETITLNMTVCCPGYISKRKKCVPVCEKLCLNSKCVAPNTCECFPGYKKFNDYRCLPLCDKCKFGLCSGPNICDCNRGYESDGQGSCRPKCEEQCINGFCSEPGTCSCNDGYEPVAGAMNKCKPKCSMPCENGVCSAPEQCSCNPGYHLAEDGYTCNPTCKNDCLNGECVSPRVCVCKDGYRLEDESGICVLIPITTLRTTTKRSCKSGYQLDESTGQCVIKSTKAPKTSTQKIVCQNDYRLSVELGKCVAVTTASKTLVQPRIAKNTPRTRFEVVATTPKTLLQPKVEVVATTPKPLVTRITIDSRFQGYNNEIPLSSANQPGQLPDTRESQRSPLSENVESNEISQEVPNTQSKAEPPVYEDLINRLHTGRKKSQRPKGRECDPPCIGGDCINGSCLCHEGNIQVEINECASKCESSCQNGKCDEDGICKCSEGYELSSDNECIPVCTMDCINGYCIEPDLCECFVNYILDETLEKSNRCIPLCNNDDEHGCVNGTCVAPNKCKCFPGYTLSESNKFHCVPMIYQIINSNYNQELYPQDSRLGVYAFYLAVVLFVIFVVVAVHYYTMRKFQKKDYHVGYNEDRYGTVAYSIEKNNLFIA